MAKKRCENCDERFDDDHEECDDMPGWCKECAVENVSEQLQDEAQLLIDDEDVGLILRAIKMLQSLEPETALGIIAAARAKEKP